VIKGKMKGGQIHNFYSETDIRSTCAGLLQDIPHADKDGFFEKNGEKYGTVYARSFILPLSCRTMTLRMKKRNIQGLSAINRQGKVLRNCFFSHGDVFEACKDLLNNDLPRGNNGFLIKNEVRHGTISAWSHELNISKSAIKEKLVINDKLPVKGKSYDRIYNFYPEPDILSACADLLTKRESKESNPKAT
jgi:hypothetical protein